MKDKFQILRDFANSNDKPDKTIYQYIKDVLDTNSAYAKENKHLKMIIKEYERLNKNEHRGFKIIDVQEYDRYELLSYKNYKDNWNNLKEYLESMWEESQDIWFVKIINKMQEIEQGSDKK